MGRAQWWGPGVCKVLAIGPDSSSPGEGAWLARHSQASSPQRAKKPFDRQGWSCCNLNVGKANYPAHLAKMSMPEPHGHIQEH